MKRSSPGTWHRGGPRVTWCDKRFRKEPDDPTAWPWLHHLWWYRGQSHMSHNVLKTINVLKHSINGSAVKVPSVIARCWQCGGQYFIKNYTLWWSGGKRLKSPARSEEYCYLWEMWGVACCLIRIVDVQSSGYSGHLAHIQWTPAVPPPSHCLYHKPGRLVYFSNSQERWQQDILMQ